jgi:hypothetical protein
MFRLIKESSSGPYIQIRILGYCDSVMGSYTLTYCGWVCIMHAPTICKCMGSHNTITITKGPYLYIGAWWWLFDESKHVARVVRKYTKYRCVWLTNTCYYYFQLRYPCCPSIHIYIQANSVITSWKGENILCRFKRLSLQPKSVMLWFTVRN